MSHGGRRLVEAFSQGEPMLFATQFKSGIRRAARALALASLIPAGSAFAGPLLVNVEQVRNDSGVVRCGLFASAQAWRQEQSALRTANAMPVNGKAVCDLGVVPAGEYAVALFHAENGEAHVQYGFLGKPRQGVGFSNNPSITFGAPDFEAAKLHIGSEPVRLNVVVKY